MIKSEDLTVTTEGFPRIALPGVEIPAEIRAMLDEGAAREEHVRAQQKALAAAMVRLGKPIFRRGKPKRKKATAHVRHMRRIAARSSAA